MAQQKETRTAAERREYFRAYHQGTRRPRLRPLVAPRTSEELSRDDQDIGGMPRRYLRGPHRNTLMWPERRATHPESLEQTLKRRVR
jgi:hypothetical protein